MQWERSTYHFYATGDLRGLQERNGKGRAYCPIHGGDHQRSFSFDLEGEHAGFGRCFNCQGMALMVDVNPEAARRMGFTGEINIRVGRIVEPVKPWQQKEHNTLLRYVPHMRRALAYDRPRAYLAQRGIPFEIADKWGVMYLPVIEHEKLQASAVLQSIAVWQDRIIFPLASHKGVGFIGRSLVLWEPGMNEDAHRALLKEHNDVLHEKLQHRHAIEPYRKTNPAGYFNYEALQKEKCVGTVEGTFDALAFMAHGIENIVAVGKTSISPQEVPSTVRYMVLAWDNDEAGKKALWRQARELRVRGIEVECCIPPEDKNGLKDWSARQRVYGYDGITPVVEAMKKLQGISVDLCTLQDTVYRHAASLAFPRISWQDAEIEGDDAYSEAILESDAGALLTMERALKAMYTEE